MAKRDARSEISRIARERILVLDGAWGTLIHGAGARPRGLPRHAVRRPPGRRHRRPRRAQPDAARLRRRGPPALPRRGRRHHDDEHVHRHLDRPGGLRARALGLRDERRRRSHRPGGGRATASSQARSGPLNVTLSLSPKVDDPGFRTHTFDQVKDAYAEQMLALAEGGVDLLLLETIFDTLNAKAAIAAAREHVPGLPLWISATIVDRSGRTLSGQTIEAFWASVEHAEPLIVGVNCSLGASEMRSYVADLAHAAPCLVSAHPNAGLPNAFGGYDETPEITSTLLREFAEARPPQRRGELLRLGAGAHGSDRRRRSRPRPPGAAPGAAPHALERPRAVRDRPRHRVRPDRRAHERHRVVALPDARRVRRLRGGGRGGARAGSGRRERARREHGRRPARQRSGDAEVPERDRDRARGRPAARDGGQLALERPRGRAAVDPGQGDRQLDQPQGGRGALPRAGEAHPRLRRRRRRAWPSTRRARRPTSSGGSRSAAAPTTSSPARRGSRPRI